MFSKSPRHFFCEKLDFRKAQRVPSYTIFGNVRFLEMIIFRFTTWLFSEPARYIRILFRRCFLWINLYILTINSIIRLLELLITIYIQ